MAGGPPPSVSAPSVSTPPVSGPPPSIGGVAFVVALVLAVAVWMSFQRRQSESTSDLERVSRLTASFGDPSGFRSDAWFLPDDELLGFVEVPAGPFLMGSDPAIDPLAFDNEWWPGARPQATVDVAAFYVGRYEVTVAQFAAFVDDNGYRRRELWNGEGWSWRESVGARQPIYWRRTSEKGWQRRRFNEWTPLEPHQPVIHVNWYEAQAYCRWTQRRLPTEAEWEVAAAAEPALNGGTLSSGKRRFPWGDDLPNPRLANSDWRHMDCLDVAALSESDGVFGCRQMIGNVWEWTVSDFLPSPGFTPDPYRDYSQPWFNTRKVLRGGCWATRARLIRNTWRNFFRPDRRDVLAGFRTCAG